MHNYFGITVVSIQKNWFSKFSTPVCLTCLPARFINDREGTKTKFMSIARIYNRVFDRQPDTCAEISRLWMNRDLDTKIENPQLRECYNYLPANYLPNPNILCQRQESASAFDLSNSHALARLSAPWKHIWNIIWKSKTILIWQISNSLTFDRAPCFDYCKLKFIPIVDKNATNLFSDDNLKY